MNGFWAIFCIFFCRPLIFGGRTGYGRPGVGRKGERRGKDWTAADSKFGPACFREVQRYERGTLGEAYAIG